ncbi:hypothetical protein K458DRAFT_419767 [Lentithecium fluviatile CBS 122367]|uniref:Yeast cell wall synthesis Kre9/Knh1-like N-terminal domain-containing protein n=1 Tax=Lentithecium fluviatile CBS 122367 TaxID=1168545 RepID=A0A6G1IWL2_9PLEO|nr:hypothetical protein K458DRAFT_419767 [Lentithecium fluviatile CBS 122367]
MRFFQVVLSGAALIAAAWALELNEVPTSLEAGKTYTITYSPKDNTPTTFILRKGDPGNLDTIGTIGTATGGSFTWTVPTDLADAPNYAFEIQQEGVDPNYSGLIPLTGGSGKDTSSSKSASPTASSYPTKSTASSTPSVSATTTTESTTKSTPATTTASGTGSITTPGLNSTITTASLSRTSSGGSSATTSAGSPPAEQTNAAAMFGSSPLALLVGAAAMAYLN